MKVISMLKSIGIKLDVDSYFKIGNKLVNAEFDYYQLKNTIFNFEYQGKTVLHFTNIESARLILEKNYLRGSNFNMFKDKSELNGYRRKPNFDNDLENTKARTFVVSFTEKIEDDSALSENYEYHWHNYGNRHKGVALEFEFSNTMLPYGFYPLRINYLGKDNPILKQILYKSNISDVEKIFLLPIFASIKKQSFKKEAEVRLMYRISNPEIEFLTNLPPSDVFFSFDKNNTLMLELRVPFSTPNSMGNNLLILKKVYLGKSFINSEDNVSSHVSMEYLKIKCREKEIELIY